MDAQNERVVQSAVERGQTWKPPFGFLLSHRYSIKDAAMTLKGKDELLMKILRRLPETDTRLIAVSVHHSEESEYEGSPTSKANVSYLPVKSLLTAVRRKEANWSEEDKRLVEMDEKEQKRMASCPQCPFFEWQSGYGWSREEETAGFTGNEAHNCGVEAVSIHKAIVLPQFLPLSAL